jgi:hypothetical protein
MKRAIIIAALLATVTARADMEWETAISQKEQVTSGLVAYWAMRNSGTTVYDEWGAYNGTSTNLAFDSAHAAVGAGAFWNGTSSVLSIPDAGSALFSSSTFTLSFWLKSTNSAAAMFIVDKNKTASARINVDIYLGVVGFSWSKNGGADYVIFELTGVAICSGSYEHVVIVRTGDRTASGYINGAATTTTRTANVGGTIGAVSHNGSVVIGRRNLAASNYFSGRIDEVRLYNRALSADEIKQLYRMGAIPKGIK